MFKLQRDYELIRWYYIVMELPDGPVRVSDAIFMKQADEALVNFRKMRAAIQKQRSNCPRKKAVTWPEVKGLVFHE